MADSNDALIYRVELSREMDLTLLLLLAPSSRIHPEEKRLVHTVHPCLPNHIELALSRVTNLQQENSSGGGGVEIILFYLILSYFIPFISEINKTPTIQHSTAQHSTKLLNQTQSKAKQSKSRQRPTADPIKKTTQKAMNIQRSSPVQSSPVQWQWQWQWQ
ncbi:hypothetical protein EAF00_007207 [Botryotinia globosa]|nr:hypothetical protein EAF00_007207 [Botryotinia globosa]